MARKAQDPDPQAPEFVRIVDLQRATGWQAQRLHRLVAAGKIRVKLELGEKPKFHLADALACVREHRAMAQIPVASKSGG